MRRAQTRRDATYDGIFFTAVKTTGIFCRPSCTAKAPRPQNVEYFFTPRQAMFAGYRPCKRCRPMETNGAPPGWAAKLMAKIEAVPESRLRASDLRTIGIDPARARRWFLKQYGMTFQAYQRARRLGMALHQIRQGRGVVGVALRHGYDSTSGFHDAFRKTFGRTPGASKAADCVVTKMIESPVGPLLAGATSNAVCLLEFTDRRMLEKQMATVRKRFNCPVVPGRNEHLAKLEKELGDYFAGKLKRFTVKLDFRGTTFQMKVWDGLLKIPYGKTWSYEELASHVGHEGAQRAVGTANGSNRIAIVIPCHRVVNKGGKLGGYGGGLWRKQFLLDLERGQRTT
ncbi:MAG TPA: methylated-DNA--[protein]-cysteine S-methyltransferase [Phycisphaerae bacterium]|nr:methylated-DNA--[protein]-cysteine S-methyltransferase [Phycisphaerae bacterium]